MLTSAQKSDNEIYVYFDVPIIFRLRQYVRARFIKVLQNEFAINLLNKTLPMWLQTCHKCYLIIANSLKSLQSIANRFLHWEKKVNRKISPSKINSDIKTESWTGMFHWNLWIRIMLSTVLPRTSGQIYLKGFFCRMRPLSGPFVREIIFFFIFVVSIAHRNSSSW